MSEAARDERRQASAADVFAVRAAEAAARVATGELALPDAVDALQNHAEGFGLVAEIGQDEVQQIIAAAFERAPEPMLEAVSGDDYEGLSSSFARACREADAKRARQQPDERIDHLRGLLDESVGIHEAYRCLNARTDIAASEVEALIYSLRTRGVTALGEEATRLRLADLSAKQLDEVTTRLDRAQVTDELLRALREIAP